MQCECDRAQYAAAELTGWRDYEAYALVSASEAEQAGERATSVSDADEKSDEEESWHDVIEEVIQAAREHQVRHSMAFY